MFPAYSLVYVCSSYGHTEARAGNSLEQCKDAGGWIVEDSAN